MNQASRPLILLLEDERPIRRFLRVVLEGAGMQLAEAETASQGRSELAARHFDLVLLDLNLPDLDGIDFLLELRRWNTLPVLVLSARLQEQEKVQALDAGADDFLTKPFGNEELLARVRALLRRRSMNTEGSQRLVLGEVEIDPAAMSVTRRGERVHLTPTEMQLLLALVRSRGRVLTHAALLREVWGRQGAEHNQYLRVYMGHLRRKLEDDPARPVWILTETGVGYRLATP